MDGVEERENEGEGVGEAQGEASWMQGKSQMLDEVNQLVEMMSSEKASLQDKILVLESEVDQYHKQTAKLQDGMKKRDKNLSRVKLEQSFLKDKSTEQQRCLCTTLHDTRRELRSVQQQLHTLTQTLEQERRCHTEAKAELEHAEEERSKLTEALQQKTVENTKLKERISLVEEQASKQRSESEMLHLQLRNSKQKQQRSRDEILALRGRLANSRKTHEQLQAHCSTLERTVEGQTQKLSSAARAGGGGRSKEEIRLAKECRKKDELLTTYLQEISTCHEEHRKLHKEIIQLQERVSKEEREREVLTSRFEESVQKNCRLQQQLKSTEEKIHMKEHQDGKAMALRSTLVEKLHSMACELERSQRELAQMREDVRGRGERTDRLKVKEEEVKSLQRQLEAARREHRDSVQEANRQWQARLTEALSDYDRLKEASTRRCVELAKEVWELRSRQDLDRNS